MRQFKKSFTVITTILTLCISISSASANNASGATPNGKVGYSGINGQVCNSCHTAGIAPDVFIEGPKIVAAGSRNLYKLTMTGGQNIIGGINVSADSGTLFNFDLGTEFSNGEISHITARKVYNDNTTVTWLIDWRAPTALGTSTIYASLLSGDNDGTNTNDQSTKLSIVVDVVDPTITTVPVIKDTEVIISAPFNSYVSNSVEFYAITSAESRVDGNFVQDYKWIFPGNIVKKGEQVAHSFGTANTYTIILETKSSNGNISKTFFDIDIIASNAGGFLIPQAKISTPGVVVVGVATNFNGAKSSPSSISQYFWDFGDGTNTLPLTAEPASSISHTFASVGQYTVTLAVQDGSQNGGLTDVDSIVVDVVAAGGGNGTGTNITSGMGLYEGNCMTCHGAAGVGGSAKNVKGATVVLIDRTLSNNTHPVITFATPAPENTQLIATYLGSNAVVTNGLSLYENKCLICHGTMAVGVAGLGRKIQGESQVVTENAINNQNINSTPPPISLMKGINLTTAEATLVTQYLLTTVPLNGNATAGQVMFVSKCQMCHGTGLGGHAKNVSLATDTFITTKINDIPAMQTARLGALKVTDLQDIASYLSSLPLMPQPVIGKGLYDMYCSYCHGLDGKGGQVAENKLPSNTKGSEISDAYNGNIESMTDSNLPVLNFTTGQLDLMASHINTLVGNGE